MKPTVAEMGALKRRDPALGNAMKGLPPFPEFPVGTLRGPHFHALARSITYQQLATKAAATIYGRVDRGDAESARPSTFEAMVRMTVGRRKPRPASSETGSSPFSSWMVCRSSSMSPTWSGFLGDRNPQVVPEWHEKLRDSPHHQCLRSDRGGYLDVLFVALVFGLVNALVKPLVFFFSLPFLFFTLGLFYLVISIISMLLSILLKDEEKKK